MLERLINPVFRRVFLKPPVNDLKELEEVQWRVLQSKLRLSYHTQLGRQYDLEKIDSIQAYQLAVPVHTYSDMEPYWKQEAEGIRRLTVKEDILCFARSSGISGSFKTVPVTPHLVRQNKHIQLTFLAELIQKNPFTRILTKKALFISGSSKIEKTAGGYWVGMISGIMRASVSSLLSYHILPSLHTTNRADKESRMNAILQEVRNQQVGLLAGIPLALVHTLKYLKDHLSGREFRYFATHLEYIFCSGTNYRPYAHALYQLLDREIKIYDLYAASEGTFGYESLDRPDQIEFFYHHNFYEFIPEEEYKAGQMQNRYLLSQLEAGRSYVVLVTSGNGAFSYCLGDVIGCISPAQPSFRILGRTTQELNLATEKTSVWALESAVAALSEELGEAPKEFFVTSTCQNGKFSYLWVFAKNQKWQICDTAWLASKLDAYLMKFHPHYYLILKSTLHPSKVIFIAEEKFESWYQKRKADIGHRKMPRIILDQEMLKELLPEDQLSMV